MSMLSRAPFLYALCIFVSSPVIANIDNEFDDLDALLNMPLESLADTKVVTATKTSLSLSDVPASVHVITSKEIERSGARSIADVLILAPGLHVAKFSDYDWTVSARSKNQGENNTLLVMIDGRSAVNPMYSGVNWDTLPVSLDSIDRIEVVLGPVGTMWGGNAVNGVINIITKDAESAPKAQLSASTGNFDYKEFKAHHSGQISENTHLSGYIESLQHSPFTDTDEHFKELRHLKVLTERFGMRADYQNLQNTVSVQFGGIQSREDYQWLTYTPAFLDPTTHKNDYDVFLTEMNSQELFAGFQYLHEKLNGDQWENQLWVTHSESDSTNEPASFTRIDLDTRYTFNTQDWGILTLGANARIIDEEYAQFSEKEQYFSPYIRTIDDHKFLNQSYGFYANWAIDVTDSTEITLGNRIQYANITEEWYSQPQVRALQKLTDNQRLWMGWGRAVITPSRLELDTQFQENSYCSSCAYTVNPDGSVNYYDYMMSYHYLGNRDLEMESVDTYEIGYRYWRDNQFQVSLSLFYSQHDNVRAYKGLGGNRYFTPDSSEHSSGTIIDDMFTQLVDPLSQETMGGEVSIQWQPIDVLQINANYSYKTIKGDCNGSICGSNELPILDLENTPHHYATLHVMWDIHPTVWVSSVVNYVSASEPDEALIQAYQSYGDDYTIWPQVVTIDMSINWQHKPTWPSIKLSAENLGSDQLKEYPEQFGPFANGTQYYAELSWNFI
ncbi:TonB-dependent receptor plug domain-containing protein [Aliivibrio fischeri]|uniref:TonB-dependent receptor plug domain-containing protein n=1 Tax=Aliivibrio fischeri TaxID=668 RepID=UPI001F1A06F0|nr:TonB-dependent receptor plug domain-containing protein [Aliivibrio fischeri]MCE7555332.1 TonB-dependent receptor plug domain-containing protein [Aliivibrio fischeri]MCE7562600.1 TonB-dependent receptor plug domain-containing protein [Aliivibrio fischeri]MCE7570008.1 TonB-dependent receptor plug domain-containing protein [Aliivibrio fischeri]